MDNAIQLISIFAARGIDSHRAGVVQLPLSIHDGDLVEAVSSFNCGRTPDVIHWSTRCRTCNLPVPCGEWMDLGVGDRISFIPDQYFDLRMSWTDYDGSVQEVVRESKAVFPTVSIGGLWFVLTLTALLVVRNRIPGTTQRLWSRRITARRVAGGIVWLARGRGRDAPTYLLSHVNEKITLSFIG